MTKRKHKMENESKRKSIPKKEDHQAANIKGVSFQNVTKRAMKICHVDYVACSTVQQWRTEGGLGCSNPPSPEIPKAHQNGAKLNPIVKTVKNC